MALESGIAHISFGVGEIETTNPPQPVRFDPHSFSHVANGSSVLFRRSQSDPRWAVEVVVAAALERLVAEATPSNGLDGSVREDVIREAARLLVEVQFAPTRAHGKRHLSFARQRMRAIAIDLSNDKSG